MLVYIFGIGEIAAPREGSLRGAVGGVGTIILFSLKTVMFVPKDFMEIDTVTPYSFDV